MSDQTEFTTRMRVEAACTKRGCTVGPWSAEGNTWPSAAGKKHARSSGHRVVVTTTVAYSTEVKKPVADQPAADAPAQT